MFTTAKKTNAMKLQEYLTAGQFLLSAQDTRHDDNFVLQE